MTTTLRIIACKQPTELYRRYDRQSEPQPCYIELDLRQGTLLADYDAEVGNARPFSVYYGFERRYGIPALTAESANRAMEEIRPLAERILADWEERLDSQSNMRAYLGQDAQGAEEEITKYLDGAFDDTDEVAQWDIDGAVNGSEADDHDITADTTDERLDEIAAEITAGLAEVSESGVAVVHGLDEYLRGLRDELAEDERMSDAEFRVLRESLGLTGDWLAGHLGVNPRTVRHWEQGKYEVPIGVGRSLRALEKETADLAKETAAELLEEYKTSPEEPAVVVYRSDEDYLASGPEPVRTAAWHRAMVARVAQQAPVTITYDA